MKASATDRKQSSGGFTLLELIVVMGILSGFLIMLVQLVSTGLELFTEGETGQRMADRGSAVERVITGELSALRGSQSGRDREVVSDRLLVQLLPIGLPQRPERNATRVQMIRAAVQLPPSRELQLLDAMLIERILAEHGELPPAELATRLEVLRMQEPLRGIGNLLMVPWRQEGDDDALLELRAAWFLPGQLVTSGRDQGIDPFDVMVPGTPELTGVIVYHLTTPILRDLLHVEFGFWSQRTQSFRRSDATASGGPGLERIWDSARGGWLVDVATGGEFAFDRGPQSFTDPTDDIHPHAIWVQCVVAQPPDLAAEGLLAGRIGEDDTSLDLVNGDHLPGPLNGGDIKVDGEWMHYAERRGDRLTGLRRGQRNTKAIEHKAGVRVHVGRTIEFVIPVLHKKDDWNG